MKWDGNALIFSLGAQLRVESLFQITFMVLEDRPNKLCVCSENEFQCIFNCLVEKVENREGSENEMGWEGFDL